MNPRPLNDTRSVALTLLTPVHVGTGEKFNPQVGFEYFPAEGKYALLDDEKVLHVLGADDERTIGQWVSLIRAQQSVLPLLRQRRPTLLAADVARRTLQATAGPGSTTELRPQMHTGPAGEVPYLPGSSLKGAIRTALLADALRGSAGPRHLYQFPANEKIRGGWSAEGLTKSVFSPNAPDGGKAPNYDWLRLLHVGDVAFAPGSTHCLKAHAYNQHGLGDLAHFTLDKAHLLEVLPTGSTGLGTWQLATTLRDQTKLAFGGPARQLTWPWLLEKINTHTRRLLDAELTRLPVQHSADYRAALHRLLQEVDRCQGSHTEAVLRLGFGSGHRAMTGDWLHLLRPDQQAAVVRASRPRNEEEYQGFPFPKSRKLLPDSQPLGFVKIILLTDEEVTRRQAEAAALATASMAEQQHRKDQEAAETEVKNTKARTPEYFTGSIKDGITTDAIYEGPDRSNPRLRWFRLLLTAPDKEQRVSLTIVSFDYAADTLMRVKIKSVVKGQGRVQAIENPQPKTVTNS